MQIARQVVDMSALTREVLAELNTACLGRSIRFSVGTLPTARCDRGLMRQVLSNLLGNAIKYTRQRAEASIEVFGRADETKNTYCVKDNGAGIDMRYADRLFGVFQRLHPSDAFEGTGVGLAIVKRIVERHGGQVWAEGAVDRGAAIFFTLPLG